MKKLQNFIDPKTWGDGKKNKKKFIDSKEGRFYVKELLKINKKLNVKYNHI
jgi:hypothetical protein